MTVTQRPYGSFEGKAVVEVTLTNEKGLAARLISFGARLTEMIVPDKTGKTADIVLGFDDLDGYVATDTYFGATCGRYGNRIKEGRFAIGETDFVVTANEGPNHLHGGLKGFDKQVWDTHLDEADNSVTFTLVSSDGDEGFPGELVVKAKYRLTGDSLLVTMSALSDKETILNMVHHSYWNVAGHASGDLSRQLLQVDSDFYTPVDDELLATGEILSVANTPFDFRARKAIGRDIGAIANAGFGRLTEAGGGYDHNWVLRGAAPGLRPVATLVDPASGRGIEIRSTEPGVQIYTGGYLSAAVIGKSKQPYCQYAGVTFETQKFPGSPNFSHFPSTRVRPGETYEHRMAIRFLAE